MGQHHSTGDVFDVQLRMLMRLIVHLDERGALDAQAFLADMQREASALPPGPQVAQRLVADVALDQVRTARRTRLQVAPGAH